MPRVVFKHIRASRNLGDTWCSPYDHIPALAAQWDATVQDIDEPTPPCDAVIYGGGKIVGGLAAQMGANDLAARWRIAWGVSTVQKFPISPRYGRAFRRLTLVGSRDWGDRQFTFAPCASCMAPEFDQPQDETHDVVAYLHHWRAPEMGLRVPPHIPVLDNTCPSFAEAVRFISSGRIVVSNSYHGVYWALLLGKRVLCIPFSNKFHNFRVAPGYASPADWQTSLGRATGSREILGLCREATDAFRRRVEELIYVEVEGPPFSRQ